jgi:hypothetical protein
MAWREITSFATFLKVPNPKSSFKTQAGER